MAKKTLDYDEVLNYIGQFGTFQVSLIYASNSLFTISFPEEDFPLAVAGFCWRRIGSDGVCLCWFVHPLHPSLKPHPASIYLTPCRTGAEVPVQSARVRGQLNQLLERRSGIQPAALVSRAWSSWFPGTTWISWRGPSAVLGSPFLVAAVRRARVRGREAMVSRAAE